LENLNLGDFPQILGNHLEAKQLSRKPRNSISGRIFISNLQQIFYQFQAKKGFSGFLVSTQKLVEFSEAWKISFGDWRKEKKFPDVT